MEKFARFQILEIFFYYQLRKYGSEIQKANFLLYYAVEIVIRLSY